MFTIVAILIIAALFGVQFYFRARLAHPPTAVESALARCWLIARRIVCFGFAGFCALVMFLALSDIARGNASLFTAGLIVFAITFGAWSFHVGLYGMGYRRSDIRDDKPVHEQRKKRYGWRW